MDHNQIVLMALCALGALTIGSVIYWFTSAAWKPVRLSRSRNGGARTDDGGEVLGR